MFEGNQPEKAVQDLYDFDILQLLYKISPESKELADQSLVRKLIHESVTMCQVLGLIFKQIEAEQLFCGLRAPQLKELQLNCFYTALLQPFYKFEIPIKGNKNQSVASYVLQTTLKRPNEI